MTKLVSEQLPNDGAYHIKRLVNEANGRLKQIGKQGKRATIVAKKTSLSLQFTLTDEQGKKQRNPGLGGIPVSAKGIEEAESIARSVTNRLVAGTFDWDWFNDQIGKDTSEQAKQLTCKEMVEQYKKHYFKQKKDNKYPNSSWYKAYDALEKTVGGLDKPLSLSLVREIIESKANNSFVRRRTLDGLVNFLKYFDNNDYKSAIKDYKADNNPKGKKRNVPSDEKIIEVYQTGFIPPFNKLIYADRFEQWQFLYGLLATYGLRIHEAWNIANWDKPVTLRDGDWVTVDIGDDKEISLQRNNGDLIIPAILDPTNKNHILCIKHDTKTGYRSAFPLSPEGHNWIEEFNLLQPLNLPDMEEPLKKAGKKGCGSFHCTEKTTAWFRKKKYGFTPHDLRHAFNHRAHRLGINLKALADSLGHSVTMNSTGYLRHMSNEVKLQGIKEAISKEQNKRSEVEILKAKLEAANNEIELLKTKLKMYEAIESNSSNNC